MDPLERIAKRCFKSNYSSIQFKAYCSRFDVSEVFQSIIITVPTQRFTSTFIIIERNCGLTWTYYLYSCLVSIAPTFGWSLLDSQVSMKVLFAAAISSLFPTVTILSISVTVLMQNGGGWIINSDRCSITPKIQYCSIIALFHII